ncbi:MAG TPA: hypothetical protein VFS42_04580 [Burkholderiaceae bacterium]|nr:hypothetical protein [Burkholderiaceae bacterium]
MTVASPLFAAPVGFADSTMVMGEFSREFQQLDAMYSPTARYSLAATATHMRDPDEHRRLTLTTLHYNRLLWRSNSPQAQFNVYGTVGVGMSYANEAFDRDREQPHVSAAAQVDYETRRIYVAGKAHWWKAERFIVGYHSLQAGFSFYPTAWDETQPWLIGEVSRMPGLSEDWSRAIYLRLINKGYFVEAGVDQDLRPRLNFRYTF